MKRRRLNRRSQILISVGLILTTGSVLLSDFIHIPDFIRGFCVGIGLGLMFIALVLQKKQGSSSSD